MSGMERAGNLSDLIIRTGKRKRRKCRKDVAVAAEKDTANRCSQGIGKIL